MQVSTYNQDTDVDYLLKKHKDEIAKLKEECRLILKDVPYADDIFLLRYILSNGSAEKSREAVAYCIEYRKDPVNKYYLDKVARGESLGLVADLEKLGLRGFSIHAKGGLDGGPVQLVRQGVVDMQPLLGLWTHEEMVRFNVLIKEEAWIICDRVTRETRKLVKLLVINDFYGMPMRKPPSEWMSAFGESSKIAEKGVVRNFCACELCVVDDYVGSNVMVNTPSWFNWIFAVVRLFLPKRTLEKVKKCGGECRPGADTAQCPFLRSHLSPENVPTYLGGKCDCKGGCVPGTPNLVEQPMRKITDQEIRYLTESLAKIREKERADIEKITGKK